MKKIMMLAALVVLGTSLSTATAGKKKSKKQKAQAEVVAEPEQPLVLATTVDSASYAAGKSATQGLVPPSRYCLSILTQKRRCEFSHLPLCYPFSTR